MRLKNQLHLYWIGLLMTSPQSVLGKVDKPEMPLWVVRTDSIPSKNSDDHSLRASAFILPVAGIAYGGLKPVIPGIGRLDDRVWNRYPGSLPQKGFHWESAMQWSPSAAVYILDAAGVKMRNRFREHLLLDIGSVMIAGGSGWMMRRVSENITGFGLREGTEFPSGHTTNAFRGAEILRQELRETSRYWSWSGYAMAGLVSFMRMRHGQHQFSEVVAGAGLGIISAKAAYLAKAILQKRRQRSLPD